MIEFDTRSTIKVWFSHFSKLCKFQYHDLTLVQKKKSEMFRDARAFTLPGDGHVLYGDVCHVHDHEPSSW